MPTLPNCATRGLRKTLFVAALLGGTALFAQAPNAMPAARRDGTAVALVRQSLLKMGALASPIRGTLSTGTFLNLRTGVASPLTIKTLGTDFLRNEVGTDFVFIRNGSSGKVRYGGKDRNLAPHILAYKRPENLPALLIMSDLEAPNVNCVMVGQESVNGVLAFHIRLSVVPQNPQTPSDVTAEDLMSETHVWIDQQGLVIKARVFNFSPEIVENRSPVDLYYSDYRQVDGFLVPFHVLREVDRQKDSDITFTLCKSVLWTGHEWA